MQQGSDPAINQVKVITAPASLEPRPPQSASSHGHQRLFTCAPTCLRLVSRPAEPERVSQLANTSPKNANAAQSGCEPESSG
ncbi:hypothetical protein AOLI_G00299870 [Acnodon oligacanthus]